MSKVSNLKNFILSRADMDYVGICPASALNGEPEGHRPTDLLPTAKSVIVYGRHMIEGAVSGQYRHLEDKMSAAQSSYAAHASNLAVNAEMINETYRIAQYLERTYGGCSMPVTFNVIQGVEPEKFPVPMFADPYRAGLPLDITKTAYMAGIGEIAWNHRLVTAQDGPRLHLTAIISDVEFEEYDEPYAGPKLCDPEKCQVCVKHCPTHAIAAYPDNTLNVNACTVAEFAFRTEFKGRIPVPDLIDNYNPTDEELAAAFKKKRVDGLSLDHFPQYFCDRCLIYCPLGNWKEKFSDRGLTKVEG